MMGKEIFCSKLCFMPRLIKLRQVPMDKQFLNCCALFYQFKNIIIWVPIWQLKLQKNYSKGEWILFLCSLKFF